MDTQRQNYSETATDSEDLTGRETSLCLLHCSCTQQTVDGTFRVFISCRAKKNKKPKQIRSGAKYLLCKCVYL